MASRRTTGQSPADAVATPVTKKPSNSDVTPAVPPHVIFKLLGFTAAMIAAPIGMYFVAVDFGASTTISGIAAAVTANVVLFAYIFVAWQEDQEERQAEANKKAQ